MQKDERATSTSTSTSVKMCRYHLTRILWWLCLSDTCLWFIYCSARSTIHVVVLNPKAITVNVNINVELRQYGRLPVNTETCHVCSQLVSWLISRAESLSLTEWPTGSDWDSCNQSNTCIWTPTCYSHLLLLWRSPSLIRPMHSVSRWLLASAEYLHCSPRWQSVKLALYRRLRRLYLLSGLALKGACLTMKRYSAICRQRYLEEKQGVHLKCLHNGRTSWYQRNQQEKGFLIMNKELSYLYPMYWPKCRFRYYLPLNLVLEIGNSWSLWCNKD